MKVELSISNIEKQRFNEIIKYEHYLHRANTTKPNILYQITHKGQIVALIEFAAVWKPVLLRFPFLQHFEIIDNARFLVRKEWDLFETPVEIYNLGSRALSLGVKRIRGDWYKKTGVKPKLLITYIDLSKGYIGTVYRAANWIDIGLSAGKNYNKKTKRDYKPSPKRTYAFPLRKDLCCQPVTYFTKTYLCEHWQDINEVAQYNYKPKIQ